MKRYSFGFVILNYNTLNETVNCVESIFKNIIFNQVSKIVIIDNNSADGSGKQLKSIYKDNDFVSVILLLQNVGFAKGNNAGINYLKKRYNCDFICCLNSDTIMLDKFFIEKAIKEYEKNTPAVIGPKIITRDNKSVVFHHKLESKETYIKILNNFKKELKYLNENNEITNIVFSEKKILKRRISSYLRKIIINKKQYNVVLQGSCLIFTPSFFCKLSGFCEDTFLYREEDILLLDVLNNNLRTEYFPKISIKHLEDMSINTVVKTDIEKRRFILENQINSLTVMISKM